MAKKPYLPNNWKKYKDAPDDAFYTPTWEEFENWKLAGWELPESVLCIIRAEEGGKIREYTYQKASAADARVSKLMDAGVTFTVCDADSVHHLEAVDYDFDDD